MAAPKIVKLGKYSLTARSDAPDFRDYIYEPPLIKLRSSLRKPAGLNIRDQGTDGSCTGFGLAAAIDLLGKQTARKPASTRMLYEMAKRYDEWIGEDYTGSSCRGSIKGWYNMGVCSEAEYPYDARKVPDFTLAAAKDARRNTIGAYYRLGERISDYHAALNETGVVFCCAMIHPGWRKPLTTGEIKFPGKPTGGHAFAIVGYNQDGFWIQNSWGRKWGKTGTALWTYEDWLTNIRDAWVFQMAVPTPQIWHLPATGGSETVAARRTPTPTRAEIAGHFLHVDDGHFHSDGRYWSDLNDVKITAGLVADSPKYDHLLFYAHGGLNSPDTSARRIAALKQTFKDNGIYPYHLMYDTGILEELKDIIVGRRAQADGRAGGLPDWLDWLVEKATRVPGRSLWREMKAGAELPFRNGNAGSVALKEFIDALAGSNRPKQIHLVGHSTGMILLSYLLARLMRLAPGLEVHTVSLMAPAGTLELFGSHMQPLLKARAPNFRIREMNIYNLTDQLEQSDQVTGAYNKSILYLVSPAFEDSLPESILGMANYSKTVARRKLNNLHIYYSDGQDTGNRVTSSKTHGGFDNDVRTMNHLLRRVLGKKPDKEFTKQSLEY